MDAQERRLRVLDILKEGERVRGTELAKALGVSRQIIVGDVALLKAGGVPVISTPRGYYMKKEPRGYLRTLVCFHKRRRTAEELRLIISLGGMVHNVSVEHEIYGSITASLEIKNRDDVDDFIRRMKMKRAPLLSTISGGIHSHLIETKGEKEMDMVEEGLRKAGFLYEDRQVHL